MHIHSAAGHRLELNINKGHSCILLIYITFIRQILSLKQCKLVVIRYCILTVVFDYFTDGHWQDRAGRDTV